MITERPDPRKEPLLDAKRLAQIMNVTPRAIYYAIERGDYPHIKVGSRIVVPTARFLAALGLNDDATAA